VVAITPSNEGCSLFCCLVLTKVDISEHAYLRIPHVWGTFWKLEEAGYFGCPIPGHPEHSATMRGFCGPFFAHTEIQIALLVPGKLLYSR